MHRPDDRALELSTWLVRERGEDDADDLIADTQNCVIAALDIRIALLAADLHRTRKLATADAIVYATALDRGAGLLTCDSHFDGLPQMLLFTKAQHGRQRVERAAARSRRLLLTPLLRGRCRSRLRRR